MVLFECFRREIDASLDRHVREERGFRKFDPLNAPFFWLQTERIQQKRYQSESQKKQDIDELHTKRDRFAEAQRRVQTAKDDEQRTKEMLTKYTHMERTCDLGGICCHACPARAHVLPLKSSMRQGGTHWGKAERHDFALRQVSDRCSRGIRAPIPLTCTIPCRFQEVCNCTTRTKLIIRQAWLWLWKRTENRLACPACTRGALHRLVRQILTSKRWQGRIVTYLPFVSDLPFVFLFYFSDSPAYTLA
jgi:hypothetical protein